MSDPKSSTAGDAAKPSGKDAKAAAKAAKAQRRAAAKGLEPGEQQQQQQQRPTPAAASNAGPSSSSSTATASSSSQQQRNVKGKQQTSGQATSSASGASSGGAAAAAAGSSTITAASLASSRSSLLNPKPRSNAPSSEDAASEIVTTIHPPPSSIQHRTQLLVTSISRDLHPSVVLLMQHLASHTLLGSSARAIATLAALKDFISDYKTPKGAALNRDLVTKLGHQISGITSARPLGSSAGNAVRYLKYEISVVPAEMGEAEAKSHLVSRIHHFIRDRIIFASRVISNHVLGKIKDQGDVILTYARSSVAEQAIIDAWNKGKRFEVICVGGETFAEGQHLMESLLSHDIPCYYAPLTSLSSLLPRVSLVLLGTASLLANGSLWSRAGTATVAMMAHSRKIPVIVCCETYKFSERVRLEAVGGNERADPTPLLPQGGAGGDADSENLWALNLLYDLTPSRYITAIASEVGLSGPESVAILLRDYKSILFGS